MDNLDNLNIPFYYFEMVNFEDLNKLYNCLDMYIVSSRFEGGPQAILECAITKTPIISTDVGVASQILSYESIFNMENYKEAKANVELSRIRLNEAKRQLKQQENINQIIEGKCQNRSELVQNILVSFM